MPRLIILLLLFAFAAQSDGQDEPSSRRNIHQSESSREHEGELGSHSAFAPFTIVFLLFLICSAKLIFNRAASLTMFFPESWLLITVGLAIGVLLEKTGVSKAHFTLDFNSFFLFLLSPIIFYACFFTPNRAFFNNWNSILLFSVIGTLFRTLAIGLSLSLFAGFIRFSHEFTTIEILQFSSLISSVDPVAIITVFEEIPVDDLTFVNILGEAPINDVFAVVLYILFKQFSSIENVKIAAFSEGTSSLIVAAVGGLMVGLLAALLTAFFTKYPRHVLCFILLVPCMGYLAVDSNGDAQIYLCGMAIKLSIKANVSAGAIASIKHIIKVLSSSAETILFIFLGLTTVAKADVKLDYVFISITILLCILVHSIAVLAQNALLQRFRGSAMDNSHFFVCYGGLRGAIAFGLASSISSSVLAKDMFLTATIAVIFFTILMQDFGCWTAYFVLREPSYKFVESSTTKKKHFCSIRTS